MKKQLFLIVWLFLSSILSNAQVSTAFNNVGSWTNEYVGWDNGMGVPLRIKHEANQPIEFYTNTGAGTFGTPKMTLANTGELGLGTASPSSWFHILTNGSGTVAANEPFRTQVPSSTQTNWRAFRNTTQMFRLNIPSSGNAVYLYSLQGDFNIGTGNAGSIIPAFQILGGNGINAGAVGIGDYTGFTPDARLHVKGNGYQYLLKATSSVSSNPVLTIEDTERMLFDFRNYTCTNNTDAPMRIDYTPLASTDANGMYFNMTGDFSSSANGCNINLENNNSSSLFFEQTGLKVVAKNNNPNGNKNYGLYTSADGLNSQNYGAYFNAGSQCNFSNYGLYCGAENAPSIYGILANAVNSASQTGRVNSFGVKSTATGSTNNYGVHGFAVQPDINGYVVGVFGEAYTLGLSSTNYYYGVQGIAPLQSCTTSTCNGAAGFFNGDVYASNGVFSSSDLKLKDQIQPVVNASALLSQIQPRQFEFKTTTFPELNLPIGQHYGFIAQDIENVMPNLVKGFVNPPRTDTAGNVVFASLELKAVNYQEFIPLLVAAFNEQKATIDSLLNALQQPSPASALQNRQKVMLSNVKSIILNQNDPNPFTESTRITYEIPEEIRESKIIFTNASGAVINTTILNERGTGELEVFSSDLNMGIYNYTLVCDGKIISTKKMVKQ